MPSHRSRRARPPGTQFRSTIHSIRFRITVLATAVFGIVLATLGVFLLSVQARQLRDTLDASLERRADDVLSIDLSADQAGQRPITLANQAGADAVIQIVRPDGEVVAATANVVALGAIGGLDVTRETIWTVDSLPIEDDEYRVLSRRVGTDDGPLVIFVAENTDEQRDVQRSLTNTLWVLIPAVTFSLSIVIWWLVGRTLRPVEQMRRQVAAVTAADLDQRVPEPGTGDEVDRLAATMNDMLSRLAEAKRQQTRFVADASHELRSPLTRMRAELDLDLADPDAADLLMTHRSLDEEVDELTVLVDDLLFLAAADSGERPSPRMPIDLDDVVLEEVGRARSATEVDIDASAVSGASVSASPRDMVRLVRNLLDNAVRHARAGVVLTLDERGETVRFTVTDDGLGVPGEAEVSIFERFTRLDDARSRDSGGTGLGLAIAREIVSTQGGTIRLDATNRSGARFIVELPTGGTPTDNR